VEKFWLFVESHEGLDFLHTIGIDRKIHVLPEQIRTIVEGHYRGLRDAIEKHYAGKEPPSPEKLPKTIQEKARRMVLIENVVRPFFDSLHEEH